MAIIISISMYQTSFFYKIFYCSTTPYTLRATLPTKMLLGSLQKIIVMIITMKDYWSCKIHIVYLFI